MQSFAVIPAAGRSVRMGRPKLLLPWGKSTVIEHVLSVWRASRVGRIVVVVHPDDGELAEVCRAAGAEVVVPDGPPPQMRDSARRGLAYVQRRYTPESRDVWLLAPADMPRLSSAVIDQLLAAHRPQSPEILLPAIEGRRGHPVLFPWHLVDAVETLPAEDGVNALLARHPVRQISCSEASILDDLDTPEDYRRLHPG